MTYKRQRLIVMIKYAYYGTRHHHILLRGLSDAEESTLQC